MLPNAPTPRRCDKLPPQEGRVWSEARSSLKSIASAAAKVDTEAAANVFLGSLLGGNLFLLCVGTTYSGAPIRSCFFLQNLARLSEVFHVFDDLIAPGNALQFSSHLSYSIKLKPSR